MLFALVGSAEFVLSLYEYKSKAEEIPAFNINI